MFKTLLTAALLMTALSSAANAKIKVVASFSILGDLVSNVGGELVDVSTIVGPDSDAHAYEPKPQDVKALADANLVVVNGLGFEGWQQRLIDASGYSKKVVTVSEGITALPADEHHDHDESKSEHFDPHAWQDIRHAMAYVSAIARGLCEVDASGCQTYKANALAYTARLDKLSAEIKREFDVIPVDQRIIITSHDAFSYLGKAFDITFLAPEGISAEADAAAGDVAKLIRQIRNEKAKALFVESISDPRLLEQIAQETGLVIGGTLYSDALSGLEGPAATYIDMMRHNTRLLVGAILNH